MSRTGDAEALTVERVGLIGEEQAAQIVAAELAANRAGQRKPGGVVEVAPFAPAMIRNT